MTTSDRWTGTVRERLALGRLLPLGGPRDGAWIAERAAREVLLAAARGVAGVRPGGLRIAPAGAEDSDEPVVPAPPSALPPGPLRVTADFAATVDGAAVTAEPLPATASRLRAALAAAATRGLGLTVTAVDLRATALLDAPTEPEPAPRSEPRHPPAVGRAERGAEGDSDEGRAAGAALSVQGVARLTTTLGRPVQVTELSRGPALPRRHVRLELAVDADHRAVEVARRVRAAVAEALPDRPSVAVLVTEVG
ncbi:MULTISPECIES: nucleopolyhedrovirus P10 family protein [unclassified Streptomyces]|uniref:nucleopolyhedrovirus P10 family protein n=1 Tax=unclassified Streptomyces TaxID=2593676 RepID=UPI0033267457